MTEAIPVVRAVVLAGGKGTRLAPYTTVLPKPLMPVGDLPILEILIRQLRLAGIRKITICVGHLASLLEAYFGKGERWGMEIEYSREETPLGTAGPLSLVQGLTSTFIVMNGDLLTTMDYRKMYGQHRDSGALVTVGLFRKRVKIDLGVVETNGDARVTGYIEKPTLNYQVSMGIYMMEPEVLEYIPAGKQLDLPDLVKTLIADGRKVFGFQFDGEWLDIGRPEDYACAADLFAKQRAMFLPGES